MSGLKQYSKEAEEIMRKLRVYVKNKHRPSKQLKEAVDLISLELIGETYPWFK